MDELLFWPFSQIWLFHHLSIWKFCTLTLSWSNFFLFLPVFFCCLYFKQTSNQTKVIILKTLLLSGLIKYKCIQEFILRIKEKKLAFKNELLYKERVWENECGGNILYSCVKWKNETCWNYHKNDRGEIKGMMDMMDSTMIYFKNLL
jgi:hypothetical protein